MNKSQQGQEVYKIILVGDQGVGKSSILLRYTKDLFQRDYNVTIGLEFASKKVTIQDNALTLQIWDTAGQEAFRSICRSFYRNSAAIIIVFKLTSRESFLSVPGWVKDIQDNSDQGVVISMVGNMSDLEAERTVTNEEAKQKAKEINALYFETSAATGQNIDDIFINTLEKVSQQNNPIRTNSELNVRESIHLSQKYTQQNQGKQQQNEGIQQQNEGKQEQNGGKNQQKEVNPDKGCC